MMPNLTREAQPSTKVRSGIQRRTWSKDRMATPQRSRQSSTTPQRQHSVASAGSAVKRDSLRPNNGAKNESCRSSSVEGKGRTASASKIRPKGRSFTGQVKQEFSIRPESKDAWAENEQEQMRSGPVQGAESRNQVIHEVPSLDLTLEEDALTEAALQRSEQLIADMTALGLCEEGKWTSPEPKGSDDSKIEEQETLEQPSPRKSRPNIETVEVPVAFVNMVTEMWGTLRQLQERLADQPDALLPKDAQLFSNNVSHNSHRAAAHETQDELDSLISTSASWPPPSPKASSISLRRSPSFESETSGSHEETRSTSLQVQSPRTDSESQPLSFGPTRHVSRTRTMPPLPGVPKLASPLLTSRSLAQFSASAEKTPQEQPPYPMKWSPTSSVPLPRSESVQASRTSGMSSPRAELPSQILRQPLGSPRPGMALPKRLPIRSPSQQLRSPRSELAPAQHSLPLAGFLSARSPTSISESIPGIRTAPGSPRIDLACAKPVVPPSGSPNSVHPTLLSTRSQSLRAPPGISSSSVRLASPPPQGATCIVQQTTVTKTYIMS